MFYDLDLEKFKEMYFDSNIKDIIGVIAVRDEEADDKYVYDILANYGDGELVIFGTNELTESMKDSLLRRS